MDLLRAGGRQGALGRRQEVIDLMANANYYAHVSEAAQRAIGCSPCR